MKILACDVATVGALAVGRIGEPLTTIPFDLVELAAAASGQAKTRVARSHGALLGQLARLVEDAFDTHRPELVAYEEQVYRGAGSRLLAKYQGVVELIAAERGIKVELFNASQSRKLALGDGGLDKAAAAARVPAQLSFDTTGKTEDEVDAVIALAAAANRARLRAIDPKLVETGKQATARRRRERAKAKAVPKPVATKRRAANG